MEKYSLVEECLGYQTATDEGATDSRYLVDGSQNVIIDRQKRFGARAGYSRLGASNTALTPVRKATTWNNSTGGELPMRMYDDELEVYLGTVDTQVINAWTRVAASWSTTEIMRFAVWWDTTENLDQLLWVIGSANLYKWGGGVATVSSVTGTTITKKGTTTFAQNRFYTTGSKTLINVRTGTEFTYTGGETTTTLTGVTGSPVTDGMIVGDILVQKIVTHTDEPAANRNNDTILVFENQVVLGSFDDNEVYISKNNSVTDYSFSAPRVSGEGALLTLDGPSRGLGSVGQNLIAFAGEHGIFKGEYEQITVGSTLAETLTAKKLATAPKQGSFGPDSVIQVAESIAYLSNEVALRIIENPDLLSGIKPRTLSNPIKPDFDAETWTNAHGVWHGNRIYLSAPASSKVYILEYIEDADGKLRRFWQPPQILPVRPFSVISGAIYGHSNSVPESYLLFNTYSDTASDDSKLPINAIAVVAYRNYGARANLKNFDEYYFEGLISGQTNDLVVTFDYDYGGFTQQVEETINGTDASILYETLVNTSLGQQPLGTQPLGGAMQGASDITRFRVTFEEMKEDFHELRVTLESNETDRQWFILAQGGNIMTSRRRNTAIMQ